jgi:hypothetical protein
MIVYGDSVPYLISEKLINVGKELYGWNVTAETFHSCPISLKNRIKLSKSTSEFCEKF